MCVANIQESSPGSPAAGWDDGVVTTAEDRWGLDSLDGITTTLVSHRIGDWEVMIGGGPDMFVVTAQAPNLSRMANALSQGELDDDDDDGTVDLTVGGQAVDYPLQYVLDRTETLQALADLADGLLPVERWEMLADA